MLVYGLIIGTAYIALRYAIAYKLYIKTKIIKNDALYFYLDLILPYFVFEIYINKMFFNHSYIYNRIGEIYNEKGECCNRYGNI